MKDSLSRIVLQNGFATLVYHATFKIVHHTLHKPVSGAPFREVLTRGVELFERYGANKWLSDDRGNGALHPDDGKWTMEVWSARTVAAGWKYWAIVMPTKMVAQLSMSSFIKNYSQAGITVQVFLNTDEALQWLQSV